MASGEKFERHRQPWRQDEIQKLHQLAGKGMSVRAIAKALTRSEELSGPGEGGSAEDRETALGSHFGGLWNGPIVFCICAGNCALANAFGPSCRM